MRFVSLIIFAAALAACAPASKPPEPPPGAVQEHVALLLTRDTRTVLAGENALALTHQCSRISPGPVTAQWTPTDADLDALETPLASLIAGHLAERNSQASPGDYYRQYAGFVIGGKRVIYVNGVERSAVVTDSNPAHPFDWRTQAIGICDGGAITFGVEYDPATKAFENFAFNGAI